MDDWQGESRKLSYRSFCKLLFPPFVAYGWYRVNSCCLLSGRWHMVRRARVNMISPHLIIFTHQHKHTPVTCFIYGVGMYGLQVWVFFNHKFLRTTYTSQKIVNWTSKQNIWMVLVLLSDLKMRIIYQITMKVSCSTGILYQLHTHPFITTSILMQDLA